MKWKQIMRRRPADAADHAGEIELVTYYHEGDEKPFETINIISEIVAKQKYKQEEWLPSFGIYGYQVERSWEVKPPKPRNWS
jgi:hypothetical protein